MTYLIARVARMRWILQDVRRTSSVMRRRAMSYTAARQRAAEEKKPDSDPRINDLGRAIEDDFATIRETYGDYPPFSVGG